MSDKKEIDVDVHNSSQNTLVINCNQLSYDESGFYKYLQKINKIPSLDKEEEFLLAKAYLENHDVSAAQKLVTSHLKLVAKIAMNYKNYGLPVPELISEGNIGLMQAVKKYDPKLGFRLSTYAMWWIKASIQEYILKSWSLVKIGTTATQKKLFFSLGKVKNKITNLYSRRVTEQDFATIAADLGVRENEVAEMNLRLSNTDLSLNATVDHDDDHGAELIEFLPEESPSQELLLIENEESTKKIDLLRQAIKEVLNPRELSILMQRKLSVPVVTLDSLSNQFSISKERVRQIEGKAFAKVKNFMLNKVISEDNAIIAN